MATATSLLLVSSSLLLILLLLFPVVSSDDGQTLLGIKQFWGNPSLLVSWNSSNANHCSWLGVSCSPSTNTVTGLNLQSQNLSGQLPPSLCDLADLTVLDLSNNNNFSGGIPSSLFRCSSLVFLNLSQNYFGGPIPDGVGLLARLQTLDLSNNNFVGDVPAGLSRLSALRFLYLNDNLLDGLISPEIGNLSSLEELKLTNNPFAPAALLPEIGRLGRLRLLQLKCANLTGPIPDGFRNLTTLQWLDLSENALTGSIPTGLFQLPNLASVFLNDNDLTGEIPRPIMSVRLTQIDLSSNRLTGTIPTDIVKLRGLTNLYLYQNQLSGEIPQEIAQISTLQYLKLFNNSLNGTLPPDLGRNSNLTYFEIDMNRFTGELPKDLCSNGTLQTFSVYMNSFSGRLPEGLGQCPNLLAIQAQNNRLSGEIPEGVWSCKSLQYLRIGDNSFSGELPSALPSNLAWLEIQNNNFSGPFPANFSNSANLQLIQASGNEFSGEIPANLAQLHNLTKLYLDNNRFTGQIPPEIGLLEKLNILDLSHNQLTGSIPASITNLPSLNSLDLSENQLTGEIPASLSIQTVTFLNLSGNALSGNVPHAFDNAAFDQSFLQNSGLCASDPSLTRTLRKCSSDGGRRSKEASPTALIAILTVVGVLALLTTALATALVRTYIRRRREFGDYASWKLTSFQKLRFTEEDIRLGMAEDRLVGQGGTGKVYRVPIGDGAVAVKRIWDGQKVDKKREREFQAEVEVLGGIRHYNVVKLLCSISGEDSRLLVYEFMERGSLDRWLHGLDSVLDWPTRYRVAIGSAQGLCYMHHECSPPVIHRDVKSSNILLDADFTPKIADFGLARMISGPGEANTVTAVAGSFGYMAPGRPLEEAMDKRIHNPHVAEDMIAVFKLGVLCTNALPANRPSMKDVVDVLVWHGANSGNAPSPVAEKPISDRDGVPLLYGMPLRLGSSRGRDLHSAMGNGDCNV
ncbi:putative LRR receptor-like serine/threonine-protein kinase [Nymphaea thermarum]|nr:putative LRR receptor-like serine/threonine-protein kinase [Nymphaea thermarum]